MLAHQVTVSVTTLTRLLRRQKLDRPHPVLEPEPVFQTDDEDRAADEATNAEIRDVGLLDRRGRVDDGLLDTLAVLSRPSVEFYGWYSSHGSRVIGTLVAGLGDEGVMAMRLADKIRIASIRNQSLPEALVAQLPEVQPAKVDAVNVRRGDLGPTAASDDDYLQDARPHVEQDHRTLRQLMARPETGLGEFYVAVRDDRGRRDVLRDPIRYVDTTAGRVLVSVSGDYLSVAPGSPKLFVERMRKALRELS